MTDRHGQVPAVYQVVGDQLPDVLVDVLFTIRKVNFATCRQPFGDCGQSLIGCGPRQSLWVIPQQITIECISYFGDGPALD